MNTRNSFTQEDMRAFEPAEKIGLLASVNPEGLPHISLITSMMAPRPDLLTLGQFCKGLSKEHIQENHRIAFLIMTLDRRMWRGRAVWTHLRREGPEYERYNEIPMFRYNTYFGINTVHYLDLVETSPGVPLPMPRIALSSLLTRLAKAGLAGPGNGRILTPFAEGLFNGLNNLKFMAHVADDGFPVIIPVIQCQAADTSRLAFTPGPYGDELGLVPVGARVAMFGLTMGMEDVLIRGVYQGFRRVRGVRLGSVDIEWVYNSMPPCHGQIYPPVELKAVERF